MQKSRKGQIIASVLFIIVSTVLIVIPTGFSKSIYVNATGAKVRILSTDDSAILNIGLFRQGEQQCFVKVLSGPHKGLEMNATNLLSGSLESDKVFIKGENAWALIERDSEDNPIFINLIDHYRIGKEILFALLFCIVLLAFAKIAGAKIIISLTFSFLLILKVLIPGTLKGYNPMVLAACILCVMCFATLFLVSGINKRSFAAICGSISSFILTFIISIIAVKVFKLHGSILPQSESLLYSGFQNLDLTSLFTAVVCLSAGGAIMDLSTDIAASMWEVKTHSDKITKLDLFKSGLAVGRAGVGTQITTLVLAYMGSYLTVMMVYMAQSTPILNILTSKAIAGEIVQSLVGCSSLLFVVPLTAFFAIVCYKETDKNSIA